jgi:hypothetical protein
VDEVILLFKRQVIFKEHIPMKHKRFGIRIYKLCDMSGYTYDMDIYLQKDRTHVTRDMTVTHTTVKQLTIKVEGHRHKLYMDIILSPDLFNNLTKQKINYCGAVRPNRKDMTQNLLP